MKRLSMLALGIILCLGLLAAPYGRSLAQSGADWGEVLNPDGSVNWGNLTLAGEVSQPADWMTVELGGVEIPLGDATYSQYLTPSGQVLVLPSPATLLMSYLDPVGSGLAASPPSALQNMASTLALMASGYYDPTQLPPEYVNPQDFFQAVIDGEVNIFSFIGPEFLLSVVQMSFDAGFLVNALWLYPPGVDCAAIPGGCPPGLGGGPGVPTPGPTPTPAPQSCPQPFITTTSVTASGGKSAPLNPVVVGQDAERRGVDLQAALSIPPVAFHWYEENTILNCVYQEGGQGTGCPGPANTYDAMLGFPGIEEWNGTMMGSPHWAEQEYEECTEHVEIFPDYLAYANLTASLSPESRAWIESELAQAYPGAALMHPDWSFVFAGPGTLGGDQAVNWSQSIPGVQVADPGTYTLRLSGQTTGTPVSAPRAFAIDLGSFLVEMVRVTLIEQP